MNADSCVFCEKPLENGRETTTLQEKGCQTVLKCSEGRGQLVEVYVGQRVHTSCRRDFCNQKAISGHKKRTYEDTTS